MEFPDHLKYSRDHEWITASSGNAEVGVTAYAIEQLGDIVHVELPEVGATFEAGESFGTIESTKTVSDLYIPVNAKVTEVNEALSDHPEVLQEDAYEKGWIIKVEVTSSSDEHELLSSEAYAAFIEEDED